MPTGPDCSTAHNIITTSQLVYKSKTATSSKQKKYIFLILTPPYFPTGSSSKLEPTWLHQSLQILSKYFSSGANWRLASLQGGDRLTPPQFIWKYLEKSSLKKHADARQIVTKTTATNQHFPKTSSNRSINYQLTKL
jgi:hypothetical protein